MQAVGLPPWNLAAHSPMLLVRLVGVTLAVARWP